MDSVNDCTTMNVMTILNYRLRTVKMVSLMLYVFYDFKCMAKRIPFKAIRIYFRTSGWSGG